MIKKTIFHIMLIVFFLTSCMSEESRLQQEYVSNAKEVSIRYGLDDAKFSFKYEGEVFSINSRKFSNLSDEQKYLYLREIDKIVENSNPRAWVMVASGDVYQLSLDLNGFSNSGSNNMFFPYGTPTATPDDKIVFNPPIEVELILTDNHPYILAADSIWYLIDYERYSVRDNNDPKLRKIYDQGYAYYLFENTHVLLLEVDDGFAKFQFIETHFHKRAGDIGWLREENIKSYPKP